MTVVETLTAYGFSKIGMVHITGNRFIIRLERPGTGEWERSIYALTAGDEILRIGSSKTRLSTRLAAWQRDVSNALAGHYQRTPKAEAEIWRDALERSGGDVWARLGTIARSPVEEFNLYQLEERELIDRHLPRCCNDVGLGRRP